MRYHLETELVFGPQATLFGRQQVRRAGLSIWSVFCWFFSNKFISPFAYWSNLPWCGCDGWQKVSKHDAMTLANGGPDQAQNGAFQFWYSTLRTPSRSATRGATLGATRATRILLANGYPVVASFQMFEAQVLGTRTNAMAGGIVHGEARGLVSHRLTLPARACYQTTARKTQPWSRIPCLHVVF